MNSQLENKLWQAQANWKEVAWGVNFLWKNEGTGGGHVPDETRILWTWSAHQRRSEFEKCQLIKGAMANALKNNFKDNSIEIFAS